MKHPFGMYFFNIPSSNTIKFWFCIGSHHDFITIVVRTKRSARTLGFDFVRSYIGPSDAFSMALGGETGMHRLWGIENASLQRNLKAVCLSSKISMSMRCPLLFAILPSLRSPFHTLCSKLCFRAPDIFFTSPLEIGRKPAKLLPLRVLGSLAPNADASLGLKNFHAKSTVSPSRQPSLDEKGSLVTPLLPNGGDMVIRGTM